jgi:hypothetical protein
MSVVGTKRETASCLAMTALHAETDCRRPRLGQLMTQTGPGIVTPGFLFVADRPIAVEGYSAAETGAAYDRARELCERMGSAPQLLPILYGQIAFRLTRGEKHAAERLTEEFLRSAEGQSAEGPAIAARRMLGLCQSSGANRLPVAAVLSKPNHFYCGRLPSCKLGTRRKVVCFLIWGRRTPVGGGEVQPWWLEQPVTTPMAHSFASALSRS